MCNGWLRVGLNYVQTKIHGRICIEWMKIVGDYNNMLIVIIIVNNIKLSIFLIYINP